jgi:release factor glutamine methyltransferase
VNAREPAEAEEDALARLTSAASFGLARAILAERFAAAGIDAPVEEADALWRAARGPGGWGDMAARRRLADYALRRARREPLDRIIGTRGFWTLDLGLNAATLSPRADTETLVELARDGLRSRHAPSAPLRILDLGTGTGAILLALMCEFPEATGLGVDLSAEAVAQARANAIANSARAPALAERVRFETGDWLEGVAGVFDLIVSNPPYIPSVDLAALAPEVRVHDPALALDGGRDGLDACRRILGRADRVLAPNGLLALEFGLGQRAAIAGLARSAGFHLLETRRDLGGIERAMLFEGAVAPA